MEVDLIGGTADPDIIGDRCYEFETLLAPPEARRTWSAKLGTLSLARDCCETAA